MASPPDDKADGKKKIDPSELWEIHGKYYDLTPFLDIHPGGKRMLMLVKGKDCTELFETVHLFKAKPNAWLKKYYVADKESHTERYEWRQDGFYETVRRRVQDHFRGQAVNLGMKANFETTIGHGTRWFLIRLVILFTIFGIITYHALAHANMICALLWGPMAFVLGGYGHEALHGGVFPQPWKNRWLALFAMDLNGLSSYVYSHVHVTAHHIHTNVETVDPDIEVHYPLIREFTYQDRKWFHRFQQFYAWPIYAVSLFAANLLDFVGIYQRKWHQMPMARPYPMEMFLFFLLKVINIGYFFVLPYVLHPFATAIVLNLVMLVPASLLINATFALNHQNYEAMNLIDKDGRIVKKDEITDWGVLQVYTSCNYQNGSWFADMLFSGLTYQIEHHLFPLVSYSKLPEIAPIVRQTCKEFGLPYYHYKSYLHAVMAHFKYLRVMGRPAESLASVPRPVSA